MRQLGVRLGITIIIALVTTVGILGNPADARAHHHRRRHRPAPNAPAPTAPTSGPCAAVPGVATMQLNGDVAFTIQCHGLSPLEPLGIDSFLIRGNCAGSNFPLAGLAADLGGNLSVTVIAHGCLAGTYSIQLVGSITNAEFPITLTF